ncbi:hypothetical protein DFH07DRAFT_783963 [Mycena maculata]|uniref:Uncharacterized protein n=1 Tax=Mycena maculata TaxID=230809 RepID=A0AAD7HJD4_9AGAR|nr:hypothetical protein DFH07DRAFT_783963 [Mycena maculata]
MAPTWDYTHPTVGTREVLWQGFLMAEALAATALRKPVLITQNDQLLMASAEVPPLAQLVESVQASLQSNKTPVPDIVLPIIRLFLYNVTHLARELSESITGDHGHALPWLTRHAANAPLLSQLEPVLEPAPNPADPIGEATPSFGQALPLMECTRTMHVRSCAQAMTMGYSALVLTLHRKMEYRAAPPTPPQSLPAPGPSLEGIMYPTQAQMNTVHTLARAAVADVGRALTYLPNPTHLTHLRSNPLQNWAQFCLEDADALGGIPVESTEAFERIMNGLKLLGYSWDLPSSSALVEQMEAHIAARRASAAFVSSASSVHVDDPVFLPTFDYNWIRLFGTEGFMEAEGG